MCLRVNGMETPDGEREHSTRGLSVRWDGRSQVASCTQQQQQQHHALVSFFGFPTPIGNTVQCRYVCACSGFCAGLVLTHCCQQVVCARTRLETLGCPYRRAVKASATARCLDSRTVALQMRLQTLLRVLAAQRTTVGSDQSVQR
jgi:hypothetical protein